MGRNPWVLQEQGNYSGKSKPDGLPEICIVINRWVNLRHKTGHYIRIAQRNRLSKNPLEIRCHFGLVKEPLSDIRMLTQKDILPFRPIGNTGLKIWIELFHYLEAVIFYRL